MLTGWLAQGLDAKRVVVIEPHPSAEITALAAQGIRLNPSAKEAGEVDTLVVAVKPQSFREAGASLKPFVASAACFWAAGPSKSSAWRPCRCW